MPQSSSRSADAPSVAGSPPRLHGFCEGIPFFRRHAVVIAAALVAALALMPLIFIVAITVLTGWRTAYELIFRTRVAELLFNTLLLQLVTLPLTIVMATGLAWLTERSDVPGARLWSWLAVAPLGIPAFVHAYGWISVMPRMGGLPGAVLISVLAYFPFLYLPVAAQLRRLDPVMEDTAASLGLAPAAVFFRVVLPQLRLAICGGALLVGLHLLAEYGLYAMIQFDTFATAIVDQFQSAYNGPAANMLGGVLVLACLLLLRLEAWLRGEERYARIGSGAPKPATCTRLGRLTLPALLLLAAVAVLAVGVPLLTLVRWLVIGGVSVWSSVEIGTSLLQTLGLAVTGAAVATLVVLPMAWLSVRRPGRWQRVLEACHYYVGALPGVVVALALVTLTVRIALPLYQTLATLILAYVLLFLPRTLVGLRASIAQAPVELERAAVALGRTPFQAVWQVTLRLAAPGAAASFALAALGITTELTATLMLAPNGTITLATRFWSLSNEIDYAGAAPYALLMVLISLPLTLMLHIQSRQAIGQ